MCVVSLPMCHPNAPLPPQAKLPNGRNSVIIHQIASLTKGEFLKICMYVQLLDFSTVLGWRTRWSGWLFTQTLDLAVSKRQVWIWPIIAVLDVCSKHRLNPFITISLLRCGWGFFLWRQQIIGRRQKVVQNTYIARTAITELVPSVSVAC